MDCVESRDKSIVCERLYSETPELTSGQDSAKDLNSCQTSSTRHETDCTSCGGHTTAHCRRHRDVTISDQSARTDLSRGCKRTNGMLPDATGRRIQSRGCSKSFLFSSSLLKFFLLAHIFIILLQFDGCESSAKWWSIVHVPSLKVDSGDTDATTSRRHFRRSGGRRPTTVNRKRSQDLNSEFYDALRNIDAESAENLLSDERIREILTKTDFTFENTGGFGTFEDAPVEGPSSRRRDAARSRTDEAKQPAKRRKNEPSPGYFTTNANQLTTNMRPPILLDQRTQALNRKQRRMLRRNPGALEQVIRAIHRAVNECKFQFRNRRWVCPTDNRDSSLFGKILNQGFRETAFIHAITSASVAHAIARGCGEGTIETCGCQERSGAGGAGWEWGGCSDNFKFGRKFAKEFADAGEAGGDLKYRMNLHNNEAGRQTVAEKGVKFCKCHGMSGSCTVQTCWKRTGDFRSIGRRLREKYDDASKVTISNQGTVDEAEEDLIPATPGERAPKSHDLVYYESSPSFCIKSDDFWSKGTRGRVCNATSNGYKGCESMCCGRGFRTRTKIVKKRCKCQFKWCCDVKCEICEEKRQISVCK